MSLPGDERSTRRGELRKAGADNSEAAELVAVLAAPSQPHSTFYSMRVGEHRATC